MEFLNEAYMQSITENERHRKYWEHYLQSLQSLDFPSISENLKVPILVPIGSRILFRGELKHTSEVTISLGADYFVKCSAIQAEKIRQHRIRGAQEKLDTYTREYDFILNQMSFQRDFCDQGTEIIEHESEEEYKAWKEEHEANVKVYRQKEKECPTPEDVITDDEIFNILEKLEIREELMKEFNMAYDTPSSIAVHNKKLFQELEQVNKTVLKSNTDPFATDEASKKKKVTFVGKQMSMQTSTYDLLQQIMISQSDLEDKLNELKNRDWGECKTEERLVAKLDAQEQLEDIEDDINRLDDLVPYENSDLEESETESDQTDSTKSDTNSSQRRVSFIDECESNTLHITFRHSQIEPNNEPYDSDKGIQKPSDIYIAYSNLFDSGTISILKKSKCTLQSNKEKGQVKKLQIYGNVAQNQSEANVNAKKPAHSLVETKDAVEQFGQDDKNLQTSVTKPLNLEGKVTKIYHKMCANKAPTVVEPPVLHKTNSEHEISVNEAVLKEVVEKDEREEKKIQPETKRLSLFKKKRMQEKITK